MSDRRKDLPETWGEVFATKYDDDPDLDVEITFRRYGGRAKYVLDVDDDSEKPLQYRLPPNCS